MKSTVLVRARLSKVAYQRSGLHFSAIVRSQSAPGLSADAPRRTIEYAVIGYGASGGNFVANLALQRLMLNLSNTNPNHPQYDLKVTVYSSLAEDGAGDGWGSEHDGCINSAIPGHWDPLADPHENPPQSLALDHGPFVKLVTQIDKQVEELTLERFNGLRDRLVRINQPGAALLLARREGGRFVTDLPCVPRGLVGQVRAQALQEIVRIANQKIAGLTIDVQRGKWATIDSVENPLRPRVRVRSVDSDTTESVVEFDKVISFTGARREIRLPDGWNEYQRATVYTGLPNAASVAAYLEQRKISPERNTIGFAGAQLSFIDLITLVGTQLGAFDFAPHEGHGRARCTAKLAKDTPYRFIVFTPEETGSVKPRLSFGMEWPGTPQGFVNPVSYLQSEHLLALRTQRGYKWLEVVQTIWRSMIAYRMGIHPSEYPKHADMMDQWVEYYEDCERFRRGEPTYCGLERILVNAAAYGYGAESNIKDAKARMEHQFPAIFVTGERMIASMFAHASIISRLEEDGSNLTAIRTLEDWYRSYSSSPVNVCQPVFQLAVNGLMKHRIGNVRYAKCPEQPPEDPSQDKITIDQSLYQVDAFFPPTPFSMGIDPVVEQILPPSPPAAPRSDHLNVQAPGIPVWHANGQLENSKGQLVNVWDCGNNRGSNLTYTHKNGEISTVKPRLAVHLLTSSHEFPTPLAATMLAHDAYVMRGEQDPSATLQAAIKNEQPSPKDFNEQMPHLAKYYEEAMKRYTYTKIIQARCLRDQWRDYFERGQTEDGRNGVIKELDNSGNDEKMAIAQAYRDATSNGALPARNPLSYDEWHNGFTDQDVVTARRILQKANAPIIAEQ
ncbi:DNA topoisomerase 1 [Rhizoctonia solani]|uniref:DNA topoisomerase 1 n=1 Tax=Rhizoctonia solani TaxID=456999 RepID=A0A0K6GJ70_9AGAM|nr:DNA topoisomerase 1 [Rhizoctonia solani]